MLLQITFEIKDKSSSKTINFIQLDFTEINFNDNYNNFDLKCFFNGLFKSNYSNEKKLYTNFKDLIFRHSDLNYDSLVNILCLNNVLENENMMKINSNFSKQTRTLEATAISTQDTVSSDKIPSDMCEVFELLKVFINKNVRSRRI